MFLGNYVVEIYDPELKNFLATPTSMGMKVEVTDPAGTVMMERVISYTLTLRYPNHFYLFPL